MKHFSRLIPLLVLWTTAGLSLLAQNYISPLRIPASLSANFGELRNNHFHSGIDFRTQQVENKPVYAIGEGHVSRINVSPGGFGLALYIDHPNGGHTSVYGHLSSFSDKITEYITQKQYERETYRIDVTLLPHEIPVRQGELIGLSGNSGSSGGPHLHFEIRDQKTQEPLEVFDLLKNLITDTQPPEIRGIAFYPVPGKGVVNGNGHPLRLRVCKTKTGVPSHIQPVTAWGTIGVGVKAYDLQNKQHGIYGVKHIRLFVDESPVFAYSINRFSFDKTRMINSFIDFEDWRLRRSLFMKSFVEPGNTLPFYTTLHGGLISIHTERNYRMRYELEDYFGNKTTYSFVVRGKKEPIPAQPKTANFMPRNMDNRYVDADCSLSIPAGNLYADFYYTHTKTPSQKHISAIHRVHNRPIPLHRNGQLWIKINESQPSDTLRMGIVKITSDGKTHWVGGRYNNGGVTVPVNELGGWYAVSKDTIPPILTPQQPTQWATQRRIVMSVSDDKSGIATFRGEINGKFVLFRHDVKSKLYTYTFDDSRLPKGQNLRFTCYAVDGVGNRSEYSYRFDY